MTTATQFHPVPLRERRLLHVLCAVFVVAVALSAYQPAMAVDWLLENLLVALFLPVLIVTYRRLPLSDLSSLLICALLVLHEWGAHHKYADVPLGVWLQQTFATTRNNDDRIAHCLFGVLLVYPIREVLLRAAQVRLPWAYYLAVEAVMAFVGMQGDSWDAQNNRLVALAGAIGTMVLTAVVRRGKGRSQAAFTATMK